MEPELHELSAAYALDALDAVEREAFERHLSGCVRCRDDVAAFTETAAALAYAAPPAAPPSRLREQLLQRVRAEQSATVLPFRRRRVERGLAAGLAIAAAAAVVLAVWAGSLHGRLGTAEAARARSDRAVAVLADPLAKRRSLSGGSGELVVARGGSGVLVLPALAAPPAGKTYEAWVIAGGVARPAGLFTGGGTVLLDRPVGASAVVAVTVEPKGGSPHPTAAPVVSSRPV